MNRFLPAAVYDLIPAWFAGPALPDADATTAVAAGKGGENFFTTLPLELLTTILSHAGAASAARLSATSTAVCTVVRESALGSVVHTTSTLADVERQLAAWQNYSFVVYVSW